MAISIEGANTWTRNLFVVHVQAKSNLLNKCIQFLLPGSNCIFITDPTVWPIATINQMSVISLSFKDSYQSNNKKYWVSAGAHFYFSPFVISKCIDVHSQMKKSMRIMETKLSVVSQLTCIEKMLLCFFYLSVPRSTLIYIFRKKTWGRDLMSGLWGKKKSFLSCRKEKVLDSEESLILPDIGTVTLNPIQWAENYFSKSGCSQEW